MALSLRLLRGASGATVPPATSGHTLIFEETFEAQSGWGAGWTADTGSGIVGGVNGGPTFKTSDNRVLNVCRAVRQESVSVQASGYTIPVAYYDLADTSKFYVTSCWFRPSVACVFTQWLLWVEDTFGNDLARLTYDYRTTATAKNGEIQFTGSCYGTTTITPSPWLPLGEWYQCWIAWKRVDGYSVYVRAKDGTTYLVAQSVSTPAYPSAFRVRTLRPYAPSNQPNFSGQMAHFRIHQATSLANAQIGPSDYLWPGGKTFAVDASTGSDANHNGPWATIDKAIARINDCFVMGSVSSFARAAGNVNYATLSSSALKQAFVVDYLAGNVTKNPVSDTLAISGLHRLSVAFYARPAGIEFSGQSGNEIRCTTIMGGSWTADGTYTKCFRHSVSAPVNSVAYAPGMRSLTPAFAATQAAALAIMDVNPWSTWVSATGDLWVSLPAATTPASLETGGLTWERSTLVSWNDMTGSYVRGVVITGASKVDYTKTGGNDRVLALYGLGVAGGGAITIFEDCKSSGYTKHVFACVNSTVEGLTVFKNPQYGGQAPALAAANATGVGTGDYSSFVDYTAADAVGNIHSYYINPSAMSSGYRAIAGETTGEAWSAALGSPYYTHTNGSVLDTFELTRFVFPGACPPDYFGTGTPPVATPTNTATFDLVENVSYP